MAEKNPLVFMDISIDGVPVGSMTFELFKQVAPCAAENFHELCMGERGIGKRYGGLPLHYKGGSYLKGGDFYSLYGRTGESIYNGDIPDVKPVLKCDEKGLLAMNMFDWVSSVQTLHLFGKARAGPSFTFSSLLRESPR